MKVTFIAPNNQQYQMDWKDILPFSKKMCENWMRDSEHRKKSFETFRKEYKMFQPYYDFLIHRMRFIQVGNPFFENTYAVPKSNHVEIVPMKEGQSLNYAELKKESSTVHIYRGSDKMLEVTNQLDVNLEGFLLPSGTWISVHTIQSHDLLAYAYLRQLMVEREDVSNSFLECKDQLNDIREFMYYKLGCALVAGEESKIAIYDKDLVTDAQKKAFSKIKFDEELQKDILEDFNNPFTGKQK